MPRILDYFDKNNFVNNIWNFKHNVNQSEIQNSRNN